MAIGNKQTAAILTGILIALGTSGIATLQGFASGDDVDKVEKASIKRDAEIERKLEAHLEAQRIEQLEQSKFRGHMAASIEILLKRME